MKFGECVRKIRNEKDESLRKLSEKTGIHFSYIDKIEKGDRPANKEVLSQMLKVYPDRERELLESYLSEVLPVDVHEGIKIPLNKNDKIISYLMSDISEETRKEILKLMLIQRENESHRKGTYEKDKQELEVIRKEIEKL